MKFDKGIMIDGIFFDIPMVSLKRTEPAPILEIQTMRRSGIR